MILNKFIYEIREKDVITYSPDIFNIMSRIHIVHHEYEVFNEYSKYLYLFGKRVLMLDYKYTKLGEINDYSPFSSVFQRELERIEKIRDSYIKTRDRDKNLDKLIR